MLNVLLHVALCCFSPSCVSVSITIDIYLSQPYALSNRQHLDILCSSVIISHCPDLHPHLTHSSNMCYQIVERYSVCRCLYYRHSIDPCQRYGQRGHSTTEKTVLVGYACPDHSSRRKKDDDPPQSSGNRHWRDSGYSSGGYQSGSTRR